MGVIHLRLVLRVTGEPVGKVPVAGEPATFVLFVIIQDLQAVRVERCHGIAGRLPVSSRLFGLVIAIRRYRFGQTLAATVQHRGVRVGGKRVLKIDVGDI